MYIVIIAFLILLLGGVPIATVMGIITIFPLALADIPLTTIIQRMFSSMNHASMLAIPAFLLAGELMVAGKISDGLIRFSGNLIGHFRGGMGNTVILSSTIFAGVSGSAIADTAAVGSAIMPAMKKKGYTPGYSAVILAFGGALGPIIPPSVIMIIYSGMTGVSVGQLFLGGAIPGLTLALLYFIVNYFYVPKMNVRAEPRASLKDILVSFRVTFWALLAPVIIIFGILGGIFSPTEAGVIAVVYAFIIGYFVNRGFSLKELPRIFINTCYTTAIIMTIIAVANAFAWLVARVQLSDRIIEQLTSITTSETGVLLLIIAFLFFIGCFIETIAAIIMVSPLLFEIALEFGFDPLQFSLMIIICVVFSAVTPPVGVLLFISASIAKIPVKDTLKYIFPFFACVVLVVLLVAFVPNYATWLPNLLMK